MRNNLLNWLILLFLVLVWGSSFILIKRGNEYFSPLEVGTLRISFAFLFFIPFVFKRIKRIKPRDIIFLAISGIVGSGIPAVLFALAEKGIDSSSAGILNSTTTLFTLIVGISFFKSKTKWFNVMGVIIGLIGASGLLSVSGGKSFDFNIQYAYFIILASIMYAFNGNIIKTSFAKLDSFTITTFAFIFAGIPAIIVLLFFTEFTYKVVHQANVMEGLMYVGFLGIVGTAIAMTLYNRLIIKTNAVIASSVTYLMPIVAVLWGIFDHEKFELHFFIWIILILLGVLLVNTKSLKLRLAGMFKSK